MDSIFANTGAVRACDRNRLPASTESMHRRVCALKLVSRTARVISLQHAVSPWAASAMPASGSGVGPEPAPGHAAAANAAHTAEIRIQFLARAEYDIASTLTRTSVCEDLSLPPARHRCPADAAVPDN